MKLRHPGKTLLLLLLLCPGFVLGQSTGFRFTNYTVFAGLSSNKVRCIFKDERGFVWIGTEDGLNLFDGHSFEVYRHNRHRTP